MFCFSAFESRSGRVLRAVYSGAALRALSSVLTLISLPLALRYLGVERFGVWATITTTVVWVNLLDLGVSNTLINRISQASAGSDEDSAARYLCNALVLTATVAAVFGMMFGLAWPRINWGAVFRVTTSVPAVDVSHTVGAGVFLMLAGLPCCLASKLHAGYQELHRYNYAACAGALSSVAGLALGIALHVSMPVLFLMSAGCITLANLFSLVQAVGWRRPWLLPRWSMLQSSIMKDLLISGSSFFLIQVAGVVVFSSDNLVISHYLGAAQVTPYNVSWRLVGFTAVLQSLAFPALWPAYAEAWARRDYGWVRRTFFLALRVTTVLNLLCLTVFVLCGKTLIRWWAGPAAIPETSLLMGMGIWTVINGFMNLESCLLAALGQTRQQAMLSVVAAAVNLTLSIVLVQRIGPLGVIGGTVLSYLLVLAVPQTMMVRKLLRRAKEESAAKAEVSFRADKDLPELIVS